VGATLPGVMWIVILVGAFISLSASFFFKVEDVRLHGILVTLLATFLRMVISMTLALDRPFGGKSGSTPRTLSTHLRPSDETVAEAPPF